MPKSYLSHSTPAPVLSRRGIAGAGAALLALASTAAIAAPASGDAELTRLGAELEAAWSVEAADAERCETDEELEAVMARAGDIVDRIEHLPASTLAGLKVKARAVSWCNQGEEIDPNRFNPYNGATTDGRLAASIVRDLLGRA